MLCSSSNSRTHFVNRNRPVRGVSRSVHRRFRRRSHSRLFIGLRIRETQTGVARKMLLSNALLRRGNMSRERVNDFAFGLGAICLMVLIGAAILGGFLATQTFVTQYSVVAERYAHFQMPGR